MSWRPALVAAFVLCGPAAAQAEDPSAAVRDLRAAVERGPAGSATAAAAWGRLVACGPAALPPILEAMDTPDTALANWLRTAFDRIAADDRKRGGRGLDADALLAFVKEPKHRGRSRRLALELVEELRPDRALTHNPLVQTLFVMQNTPQIVLEFGGLKLGALGVSGSSRFDLVLFINNPETDPSTMWVYNPNLFDASTIARMANNYEFLLKKAWENSDATLESLFTTLDEAEKQQRRSEQKKFQEAGLEKLRKIRRKAIEV